MKNDFIENITNNIGGAFGYNPEPLDHVAFYGERAIWHEDHIENVPNRQSFRGKRNQIMALIHWWCKRGGVESKWLKSPDREAQPWTYKDAKTGNVAQVRMCRTANYVYITLYHDDHIEQ